MARVSFCNLYIRAEYKIIQLIISFPLLRNAILTQIVMAFVSINVIKPHYKVPFIILTVYLYLSTLELDFSATGTFRTKPSTVIPSDLAILATVNTCVGLMSYKLWETAYHGIAIGITQTGGRTYIRRFQMILVFFIHNVSNIFCDFTYIYGCL